MPNVKLFFEHSLESADFEKDELKFRSSSGKSILIKDANLILGADGAYSQLRTQMMKRLRMDYEQTYIDHAYVELCFPPSESGDYVIASDHLHIWPRQTFMMIALPNLVQLTHTGSLFYCYSFYALGKV
jgi:kynurenine 3-monooxygenase